MSDVVLEVAGIRIEVTAADAGLTRRLADRFSAWTPAISAPPDVVIDLRERGAGWRSARPYDETQYPRAEVRHGQDGYRMWRTEFDGSVEGGRILRARFDVDGSTIAGFETPLRLVTALAVSRRQSLLVHASGAVFDAGAVLFPAPSGGGKSTTLSWLPSHTHLSDDICVVAVRGGHGVAGSTPFSGAARPVIPVTAPLAGVCFLEKAASCEIRPLGVRESFRRLLGCALTWADDVETLDGVLGTALALCRAVPCYRLAFAPSAGLEPFLAARFPAALRRLPRSPSE